MPEGYRKFRLKTLISGIMLAVQNTQGKLSSEKGTMILTEWLDEKLARSLLYRPDSKQLNFCVGLNRKESNKFRHGVCTLLKVVHVG